MTTFSDLQNVPRAALTLAYVLLECPHGATYRGLRVALGQRSDSAVRKSVRLAREHELVRVTVIKGRGGAAIVTLLPRVRRLLKAMFTRKD